METELSEINIAEELDSIQNTGKTQVDWTEDHEKILVEWADKAMCYRWLHARSNSMYSSLNAWYTIPVIVISTLTGTANFAQERVPLQYQNYFVMLVGGFNLLAGIITTIQQFLKITQLNESHRVSSISWDKFYRNVKTEIAKHPHERIDVIQMIKMSKEEFDRLMETSPNIPDKIIQEFKISFDRHNKPSLQNSSWYSYSYWCNSSQVIENSPLKEEDIMPMIIRPEICDALISTEKYRNPWYNDENKDKQLQDTLRLQMAKEIRQKKLVELQNRTVQEFKQSFYDLNNREPMDNEIIDNLHEKIETYILQKIIDAQKKTDNVLNNV
jgi:hypothetical protein